MIAWQGVKEDAGMTASIQICLADADASLLAALSVGVIVVLVWLSVHEYRRARRMRRRHEDKRRKHETYEQSP